MATKDIQDACKAIRDHWEETKRDFIEKSPGFYLELTAVFRSPEEQFELYKRGRTMGTDGKWVIQDKSKVVTNVDGYNVVGAHNYKPSRAVDVVVVDNQSGKYTWDEQRYHCLVDIAKHYGLESGGSWNSFKDWPHIQVRDYKNYSEI